MATAVVSPSSAVPPSPVDAAAPSAPSPSSSSSSSSSSTAQSSTTSSSPAAPSDISVTSAAQPVVKVEPSAAAAAAAALMTDAALVLSSLNVMPVVAKEQLSPKEQSPQPQQQQQPQQQLPQQAQATPPQPQVQPQQLHHLLQFQQLQQHHQQQQQQQQQSPMSLQNGNIYYTTMVGGTQANKVFLQPQQQQQQQQQQQRPTAPSGVNMMNGRSPFIPGVPWPQYSPLPSSPTTATFAGAAPPSMTFAVPMTYFQGAQQPIQFPQGFQPQQFQRFIQDGATAAQAQQQSGDNRQALLPLPPNSSWARQGVPMSTAAPNQPLTFIPAHVPMMHAHPNQLGSAMTAAANGGVNMNHGHHGGNNVHVLHVPANSGSGAPNSVIKLHVGPHGQTPHIIPREFESTRSRPTPKQVDALLEAFRNDPFPSLPIREKLAKRIGMSVRRVQVWFQNRRQAARLRHKLSGGGSNPTAKELAAHATMQMRESLVGALAGSYGTDSEAFAASILFQQQLQQQQQQQEQQHDHVKQQPHHILDGVVIKTEDVSSTNAASPTLSMSSTSSSDATSSKRSKRVRGVTEADMADMDFDGMDDDGDISESGSSSMDDLDVDCADDDYVEKADENKNKKRRSSSEMTPPPTVAMPTLSRTTVEHTVDGHLRPW